ncbi:hypothetical protein K431DRAFT_287772 [Polychaeton citri CBS 116435]|uniref:Uncharacterized protein n=1 Tax=Polychaeton citri CBS 116435 TaxID=1314669 RepID=A0A9P4Q594_9PEZI|nr:hypothetical protein K431DRAFT_287772 [Polychaeton citri CBS 116435]
MKLYAVTVFTFAAIALSQSPQTQVIYDDVTSIDEHVKTLTTATAAYQGGLLSQAPLAIDFVPVHLATRKGYYDSLSLPAQVSIADASRIIEHVNQTLSIDNPKAVDTLISKKALFDQAGSDLFIKSGLELLLSDHLSFSNEVLKRAPAELVDEANQVVGVITVALQKGIDTFSS